MPDLALSIDDYLARIAWGGGPFAATPESLVALHWHQIHAIPFENIDPFSGRPVSLETPDLVEKLIRQRRGGYCFELNTLFLLALEAIGFRLTPLCARVWLGDNYGPRTHQITLVEIGGHPWLADVGFGGRGLIEAIPFELDREFPQAHDTFRLVADPVHGHRLEHRRGDEWSTNYAFSLDPCLASDYRVLNYFISRSADSVFTRLPICVRTTPTERRILVGDRFKTRTGTETRGMLLIKTATELRDMLAREFDLALPRDYPLPAPPPAPNGMRDV